MLKFIKFHNIVLWFGTPFFQNEELDLSKWSAVLQWACQYTTACVFLLPTIGLSYLQFLVFYKHVSSMNFHKACDPVNTAIFGLQVFVY